MLVGAVGISIGLMLFGPKLIKTVGQEITKLNPVRAFCVALSAAITVIIASALGLPVSSTHIAVGGVFGVGFLREYLAHRESKRDRLSPLAAVEVGAVRALHAVENATPQLQHLPDGGETAKAVNGEAPTSPTAKAQRKAKKRMLVRRNHAWTIAAAWIITVPLAAILSAALYYAMVAMDLKP